MMICHPCSLILLSLIPLTQAAWRSCTPGDQNPEILICEYSTKTEHCPKNKKNAALVSRPLLQPVDDIEIYKYFNNVVNYTGAKISWSSPTAAALNATAGYALSLYATYYNGSKELLHCRRFRIRSKREIATQKDASHKFAYMQTAIPYYNTDIDVELTTLPAQPSLYSPASSLSSFTTYGNPVDKFQLNGSVAASSLPYTATVRFRLSSYPTDTRVLYNATKYDILLAHLDTTVVKHINDSIVDSISIPPDKDTEYAEVTFYSLKPGPYVVQVRPYIRETPCPFLCDTTVDIHQLSFFRASVAGYDYVPAVDPTLNIMSNTEAIVSFQVAPSYLYIVRYEVVLWRSHGRAIFTDQEVRPPAANDWYTYEYTFNIGKVIEEFNDIKDTVYVEIVSVSDSELCDRPGRCNLNGTCTNCTKSFSASVELPLYPVFMWPIIGKSLPPIIVVLIIVITVYYCIWKRRKENGKSGSTAPFDDHSTTFSGRDESVMVFGPTTPESFLAFAANERSKSHYEDLYLVLSDILSKYFSCTVHRHSDIYRGNSFQLQIYNSALIICTPELCEFHQRVKFLTKPDALPQDMLYHLKVMNLLLAPPSPPFKKILVTFDHIPRSNVDELTRDLPNRLITLSLPSQLKELVLTMYSAGNDTEVSSWGIFSSKGKLLRKELVAKIEAIGAFYGESGYDTATVTTDQQILRLNQTNVDQEIQVLQNQQNAGTLPVHRVGEIQRFPTIQPRAEEMQYLNTLSADQCSVITVPSSVLTCDTLSTVYSEQQNLVVPSAEVAPPSQEINAQSVASEEARPLMSHLDADQSAVRSAVSTFQMTRSDGAEVYRVSA
ncbi:uncharacterized protein [Watersipora subatra]|uniref:uncharacterized protein n=1 Tax=Watersipora subatra TaxID=2589382 RepID=UPI00355B7916